MFPSSPFWDEDTFNEPVIFVFLGILTFPPLVSTERNGTVSNPLKSLRNTPLDAETKIVYLGKKQSGKNKSRFYKDFAIFVKG